MARQLVPLRRYLTGAPPPSLRRLRSSIAGVEVDLSSCPDEDSKLKKLDDIVQKLMVQRATPDWLPFLPGASFWVPPRSPARTSAAGFSFADLISNISDDHHDSAAGGDLRQRAFAIVLPGNESEQGTETEESAMKLVEIEMEMEDDEALSNPNNVCSSEDEER